MRIVLFLFFLAGTHFCFSQKDSSNFSKKWHLPHSPLKATVYSSVIPGLGQVYNKKIWKTPIVLGGMGTCVFFISKNSKEFQFWKSAYIAVNDTDPNTNATGIALGLSKAQIDFNRLLYKKYLDISYLSLIGVYALQILDAHVDAHLFQFDVSPNLSLRTTPIVHPTFSGIHLTLQFIK
ncbi:MAG: DUF5683 domain-containing protein [Bacteroidota bacterium]|jgi:Family of unknown function (DUF5683)